MITAVTNAWQPHAHQTTSEKHPFRKYFEELNVGDTVITHKRTVTESDITSFANVSWDHFYAHTDHTSLEGTLFEKPVAHGYFILSAAAGLQCKTIFKFNEGRILSAMRGPSGALRSPTGYPVSRR